MAVDPYRTLGLEPGASAAEIKRAYRRLAKAFHPDSGGDMALPQFLAIHEAYEQLISGRRPGRSPGASATTRPTSEPWRADPARARAAREQARTRRTRASGPGAGAAAGGGAPGGGAGGTRTGRPGASSPGSTASGSANGGRTSDRPSDRPRRRSVRKATLGSTSYDDARDSADPAWGGAAWYGPTSGEYWTVNPKEYADPRKHGPEYQSRARRVSTTGEATWDRAAPVGPAAAPPAGPAATPGFRGAPAGETEAPAASAGPAHGPTSAARRTPTATSTDRGRRAWTPPAPRAVDDSSRPISEPPPSAMLGGLLEGELGDPVRRLGLALLAWAPLGVASAAAIGRATGCSSYAASCGGTEPLLPWLAQATILGILLLAPPLSRVLAVGTVAIVLALVPVAGFFIAFGGAGQPEGAAVLVVALAVAWGVGIAVAVRATWRLRGSGGTR